MSATNVQMTPFKVKTTKGPVAKGLLFQPAVGRPTSLGFVYMPGIVLGMAAVHRLGVATARLLASQGHSVCLFDPPGVGESEGEYPAGTHDEVTSWVIRGAFVQDTLEVIDHFVEVSGVRSVGMIGHCGGALTAAYAGAHHPKVSGLFLVSPPPCSVEALGSWRGTQVVDEYFALYRSKLFSPAAWKRLLLGRTNYRNLLRVLARKLGRRTPAPAGEGEADGVSFNPMFVAAIAEARRQRRLLSIVYGDRDPDRVAFEQFQQRYLPPESFARVFVDTSHGFITVESLELLMEELVKFARALSGGEAGVSAQPLLAATVL